MKSPVALIVLLIAISSAAYAETPAKSLVDQQADSLMKSHKVFIPHTDIANRSESYNDSVQHTIQLFYVDQFRHFQDPQAPYFLFMSKDTKLAMGIGGAVRMRGYFDWGGAIPASGFAPYLIPMHPDPTKMRKFDTTPAGSCLFFKVIGQNKTLGSYQLYIEANFNGYQARDFHLKKAYAIVDDFTIGYAASTFSDPAALPPTVDAQGPNNKISNSNVLIRWMPTFREHWVLALSAETPTVQASTDNVSTKKIDNWIPDGAAFVQYQWGPTSHVRLSGIVRSLSYRDMINSKNHYRVGWGLLLSSVAHPHPALTTYTSINYGKGYAGLGGDLLIGNYDLVNDPARPGYLYAPASFGWCLGVQYNILPNLFVSASFSQTRYLPSHRVAGDEYKYGLMGDINIFWNLTPRIEVGAEFDWGRRKEFSGEARSARRIGAVAQFSF